MRTVILGITMLLLSCVSGYAQYGRSERVKAIRVAFITDRLHLSSEQAARFWPVFNKFTGELRNAEKSFNEQYEKTDISTADDATARQYIDDFFTKEDRVLSLKKQYKSDFLKVITPQQYAQLPGIERDFKMRLLQEMRHRHEDRDR